MERGRSSRITRDKCVTRKRERAGDGKRTTGVDEMRIESDYEKEREKGGMSDRRSRTEFSR
jgi:hypothetical protein